MSFKNKVLHMICLCVIPILLMVGCGGEQEESAEEPAFLKADPILAVTEYFDDFGKDPEPGMMRYHGYSATDQENYYRIQSYIIESGDMTDYAYYLCPTVLLSKLYR